MLLEGNESSLQGRSVRFETRSREFVSVVRLIGVSHVAIAKAIVRTARVGHRLKGREITGARSEERRSNPGQGEVSRKRDGSLLPVVG